MTHQFNLTILREYDIRGIVSLSPKMTRMSYTRWMVGLH